VSADGRAASCTDQKPESIAKQLTREEAMGLKSSGIGVTVALAVLVGGIGVAGAVGLGGICGPILNGACDPGLFCDKKPGTCRLIGGTGRCVRIPVFCPLAAPNVVLKVCGCNGVTYFNDCERIKAMEQKAHNGPCK